MDFIDLRSDTVTRPTSAMTRAMARAEVGDDVYLEDPTVNRLQERAAEIFEKEAALFVPSGTMGNQICIKLQTRPGTEVVVEERSHIFDYEMGSSAILSGVTLRPARGAVNGLAPHAVVRRSVGQNASFRADAGPGGWQARRPPAARSGIQFLNGRALGTTAWIAGSSPAMTKEVVRRLKEVVRPLPEPYPP